MPNKIKDTKQKVVYNEYKDTLEVLLLIAERRRCSLSDIMRLATLEFAERNEGIATTQRIRNKAGKH
jgi:hypothetical protein